MAAVVAMGSNERIGLMRVQLDQLERAEQRYVNARHQLMLANREFEAARIELHDVIRMRLENARG